MSKAANTDGQISSVSVTIGAGSVTESVKKEIDKMVASPHCAKLCYHYIGGWLDGSNLDAERIYFKTS